MTTTKLSREEVLDAARRAAEESGSTSLSRNAFEQLTGISQYHIYRLFPEGGWSEVVKLAGLDQHPHYNAPLSDERLLSEFHRVATSVGRIPSWHAFGARANISADTLRQRFGGLQGTLKRYRSWLEENEPQSSLLPLLQTRSKHEEPLPPIQLPGNASAAIQWSKIDGVQYGAPINFRGLRHAPINEQGVVYLFGMVSYELGFLVEAIHPSFPDCEAKRCINQQQGRWRLCPYSSVNWVAG